MAQESGTNAEAAPNTKHSAPTAHPATHGHGLLQPITLEANDIHRVRKETSPTATANTDPCQSLSPKSHTTRCQCRSCGQRLTGRQRMYCSDRCRKHLVRLAARARHALAAFVPQDYVRRHDMACVWAPSVGCVAGCDGGFRGSEGIDAAGGVGLGGVAVGERPGLVESAGECSAGIRVAGGGDWAGICGS